MKARAAVTEMGCPLRLRRCRQPVGVGVNPPEDNGEPAPEGRALVARLGRRVPQVVKAPAVVTDLSKVS